MTDKQLDCPKRGKSYQDKVAICFSCHKCQEYQENKRRELEAKLRNENV